ncbi:hypothetical protein ACFL5Z_07965, partial [Planctomycetota bacterium]
MKAWQFVLTTVLFVVIFSLTGRSVENPGIRNPAGYGTIPPSSYRNGLVGSPNPIDVSGNLLMTGNVRRGMHFRGPVPYRSTTSFSTTLGSSALDSFLRDTAGSGDFGGLANKYRVQPFYSPTQTVTTMIPGRSEVFNPMGIRIDDRVRQGTSFIGNGLRGSDSLPRGQTSLDQDTVASGSDFQNLQKRYHPLVEPPSTSESQLLSGRQIEQLVPGQLGIRQYRKASPKGERDKSTDRSGHRADDISPDPSQQENLQAQDGLTRYPGEDVSLENLKSGLEMLKPVGSTYSEPAKGGFTVPSGLGAADQTTPSTIPARQNDFLPERSMSGSETSRGFQTESERLRSAEYGDIAKYGTGSLKRDAGFDSETLGDVSSQETFGQEHREVLEQIRRQLDALTKSVEAGLYEDISGIGSSEFAPQLRESLSPSQDARDTEFKQRGGPELSTNAERIKGTHDSLESFSQSRFNQHIATAEDHLKAGRYYRAVDSFTLASVYQPNNPVVSTNCQAFIIRNTS